MPQDRDKPRVIWIGKNVVRKAPSAHARRKFSIMSRYFNPVVVAVGPLGVRRVEDLRVVALPNLKPSFAGGILFYLLGPLVAVVTALLKRAEAIVCQSPYEGVGVIALARLLPPQSRPLIVVEVHGDWRSAAEFYGSQARRGLRPVANSLARWSLSRADRVRVIGDYTLSLVKEAGYRGPIDRYLTFSDFRVFTDTHPQSLPADPVVAFVGVFERYKAIDVLIPAWARVVQDVPNAHLLVVGDGPLKRQVEQLIKDNDIGRNVTLMGVVDAEALRDIYDRSCCLVLPSRSEGMGRVILEALARGRPTVGSRVGGIPELIEHGVTGVLVNPEDEIGLAAALTDLLQDRTKLEMMARNASDWFREHDPTADFEEGIRRLASSLAR